MDSVNDVRLDIDGIEKPQQEKVLKTARTLQKWKSFSNAGSNSFKSRKWTRDLNADILQFDGKPLPKLPEEEEAVGIITMEDVIEELLQVQLRESLMLIKIHEYSYNHLIIFPHLDNWFPTQEEIFDETDHHMEDS